MNPVLFVFLLSALPPSAQQAPGTPPAAPPAQTQQPVQGDSNRSVIKPKPGQEALKEKDLYDRTGYLHPFRRMPKFILYDQKAIWTSPFHTSKQNAKWWAIWGVTVGGLIASDRYIQRDAPNNATLVRVGNDASYLGEVYTLLPIAAGMYFIGTSNGSDHFRETGLLSFEALANVGIMDLVLKSALGRERPTEGKGNGAFQQSPNRVNSSFPSGHTISTFALASVVAHEYHHHTWVKALIYGYGIGVGAARLAANKHFPSDVVAGGVMGWFVGDYVYGKRHNSELDKKSTAQTILSHISIGGAIN
ncbi:MAG TPA: phosphatase PAP2 family protein [Bryobacteraceae bacterium]|nr:phosphatase PAP2 family protein [Bryobacteraceae bacterium]